MSDYSDVWYELHEEQCKKEYKADETRQRMMNEFSIEQKIDIIFDGVIKKMSDYEVIHLGQKLLMEEK